MSRHRQFGGHRPLRRYVPMPSCSPLPSWQTPDVAVLVGWYDGTASARSAAWQEGRKAIVELMGDRRTGPVCVATPSGEEADRFVAEMVEHSEHPGYYRQIRGRLVMDGGALMVVFAAGNPPGQ